MLTLFDRSQKPIGQWRGTGEFYKSWLEYVANNNPCIFICDSDNIQSLLKTWRNQNVIYVSPIHVNHVSAADREQFKYASPRADLYKHLDSVDLVVTLTESQRIALQE